jgi:hypothetical protein
MAGLPLGLSDGEYIKSLNAYLFPRIGDRKVIGVNKAFMLGEWVDIAYFGDSRFVEWYYNELLERKGIIVSCANNFKKQYRVIVDKKIFVLKRDGNRGAGINLQRSRNRVGWFGNTGASAIHLAVLLGAKKVVLLGYDGEVNNKNSKDNNWHSGYPGGYAGSHRDRERIYTNFRSAFTPIARDCKSLGVEVINATPDSKIKVFDLVEFEEEFKNELE